MDDTRQDGLPGPLPFPTGEERQDRNMAAMPQASAVRDAAGPSVCADGSGGQAAHSLPLWQEAGQGQAQNAEDGQPAARLAAHGQGHDKASAPDLEQASAAQPENGRRQGRPAGSSRIPLPERLRPNSLDAFLGQPHLEKRIQALIDAPRLPSLLFFGPPGCGKSTIALLLARSSGRPFRRVSAPEAGVTQLRKMLEGVDLLVLDELHRFSKAQQDFFLPLLENGSLTLLATTTENPSFSVTRQLLSRLSVLRLRPLDMPELLALARRGADQLNCELGDDILIMLADYSRGDARALLNLVEYVASLPGRKDNVETVKSVLPDIVNRHDRSGDSHYELASALIKSIRGTDPDAALYYLVCLLEGGEDPRFICRRLILSASEDVGLADPHALTMAVSCQQAVEFVGMPEGFIPLAETVVYLALARKSNSSYAAFLNARKVVRAQGALPVPLHLRNATTQLQKDWGYGRGYQYPHNFPDGWVEQGYLPDGVATNRFYYPKDNGEEPRLSQWWKRKKRIRPSRDGQA